MPTRSEIRKLADAADRACEELRDALQEFFDEKSEKWQEGDAGTDWSAWIDEADNAQSAIAGIAEGLA